MGDDRETRRLIELLLAAEPQGAQLTELLELAVQHPLVLVPEQLAAAAHDITRFLGHDLSLGEAMLRGADRDAIRAAIPLLTSPVQVNAVLDNPMLTYPLWCELRDWHHANRNPPGGGDRPHHDRPDVVLWLPPDDLIDALISGKMLHPALSTEMAADFGFHLWHATDESLIALIDYFVATGYDTIRRYATAMITAGNAFRATQPAAADRLRRLLHHVARGDLPGLELLAALLGSPAPESRYAFLGQARETVAEFIRQDPALEEACRSMLVTHLATYVALHEADVAALHGPKLRAHIDLMVTAAACFDWLPPELGDRFGHQTGRGFDRLLRTASNPVSDAVIAEYVDAAVVFAELVSRSGRDVPAKLRTELAGWRTDWFARWVVEDSADVALRDMVGRHLVLHHLVRCLGGDHPDPTSFFTFLRTEEGMIAADAAVDEFSEVLRLDSYVSQRAAGADTARYLLWRLRRHCDQERLEQPARLDVVLALLPDWSGTFTELFHTAAALSEPSQNGPIRSG